MSFRWLVFGGRGFVGGQVVERLRAAGQVVLEANRRVGSLQDAQAEIARTAPDRIVCALGRTHTATCPSIDGLEDPAAWPDLVLANHHAPIWIAQAAGDVHVLYLGTGCIFTGGALEYVEETLPNFFGSAYSRVKALTDAVLGVRDNVLVARIRMPVADEDGPRDLLCKLWSYPVICDEGVNSVTVLSDILPALLCLAAERVVGVYNAVNPQPLTHPEILAIFAEHAGRRHEHKVVASPEGLGLKAARSRCALSAAKLQRALAEASPQTRALYRASAALPTSSEALARVARLRAPTPPHPPPAEHGGASTILVTGGCGFIGSHFVRKWLDAHPDSHAIVNVDCLDEASGAKVSNVDARLPRYEHLWLDLTMGDSAPALARIMTERSVRAIVHFAAKTHVDDSFDGDLSVKYTMTNVVGTHNLLEAARRYGRLDMFLHVSTDEVYGDSSQEGASEESTLQPTNPYAASKAAAEMLVKAYQHSLGLPCSIVRLNNVYGPRQDLSKVIPRFCVLAARGDALPLHGGGGAKRCFIHAADACSAIALVLAAGRPGEVYNVGGGRELTVLELAKAINALAGSEGGVASVEDRPYNDQRYLLNDSKLRKMGWHPGVPFEEGLAETFASYASPHMLCSLPVVALLEKKCCDL